MMSRHRLPDSVRRIFDASADVQPAPVCIDYGPQGSLPQPVQRDAGPTLPGCTRFGLESQLDALAHLVADIEQRRPELWKATDQARVLLDGMQRLLNDS